MATGNQVLPGVPATAEHAAAGRPVTAEHGTRTGQSHPPGQPMGAQASSGYAMPRGYSSPVQDPARRPRLWPGAGGRWLVWLLRVVLWTVLLLIGYRGVAAIVTGYPGQGATADAPAAVGARQFPVALAQAYALEFGQVYLSFNPARAEQRARSLAAFLPPGTDPKFGWNGAAAGTLQSEHVAGIRVVSAHRAVVTLLARVSGHLIELGVPIYAAKGGLVVSGYPALLPAPVQVAPPGPATVGTDRPAARSLARRLPAFFRAFASGDVLSLSEFTARPGSISGLGGAVSFGSISRLSVRASAGPVKLVTVTVVWRVGAPGAIAGQVPLVTVPATLTMSYALAVVRHGASWQVRSISAAATQPWPSP
jgi:hypothetical protein